MDGAVTPLPAKLPFAPMLRHFSRLVPRGVAPAAAPATTLFSRAARATRAVILVTLVTACADRNADTRATDATSARGQYVFVFAGHADHAMHADPRQYGAKAADTARAGGPDFLAVIDVDSTSPTYAQVVATLPTGQHGEMPHHTEMLMPTGGRTLAANAYIGNVTYLFDLADPLHPRLAGRVDSVPGFSYAHTFARLPNGDLLGTLQFGDGRTPGNPGALARFDDTGHLLRAASVADPAMRGAELRAYSLDVNPAIDRVLTTSIAMDPAITTTADAIQVHRLSDLSLVRTLVLPPTVRDSSSRYPFEVRFLADGRRALLNTVYCGFYLLDRLDTDAPSLTPVLALEHPTYLGCAVPQRIGRWWIMPVESVREILVFDVSDPLHPRRTTSLAADSSFTPHWIARDPHSDRLVITGEGPVPAVRLARFDSTTGAIRWEERFRSSPDGPVGVSFDRAAWPHGRTGKAAPHGAVFSRR